MAGALALVLILGASMGTAAAPDPALSDDLAIMGDAGNSQVTFIDIDAQAVVNTMTGPDVQSNHGVLWDGQYIWTANAAMSGYDIKVVKLDTASMDQVAAYTQYVQGGGGLCGIEFAQNNSSNNIWTARMSNAAGEGGAWEVADGSGFTGSQLDTANGADSNNTCGLGWDSTGTVGYASLMPAKAVTERNWTTGTLTGSQSSHSMVLHIMDTAKAAGYGYVSAGAGNGIGSSMDVVELSSMTKVGSIALEGYNPHSVEVTNDEGFAYSHSREVGGGQLASILVYDIGGGSAGGTMTAPVLIGQILDGGGAGSCGVDVAAKSDYCGQASLSLSKGNTYWKSPSDYANRNLTVDFTISNSSGDNVAAHNVSVHHTTESNGVTSQVVSPIANIAAGGSSSFSIDYDVPPGVAGFSTMLHVTTEDLCGNVYSYGS
jgi:hypothetical protein